MLLLDDADQTIELAKRSLESAARWAGAQEDPPPGELFLESLGVSDEQRAEAARLAASGARPIDPAVSVLIGATNGIAYRHLVARLETYPIPEIRLPPGDGRTLLDVGCSWGRWSIAAARKGYRVVGIDPSLGALMAARRTSRQFGLDIDFVCADARFLPFPDDSFDVSYSYSVIQHFSKPAALQAFAEIARVTLGHCLVQMPNARGIRSLYHRARRGFSEGRGFEVRYWTIPELTAAFAPHFRTVDTSVHCFFGLGLEASDAHLVSAPARILIRISESLRQRSAGFGALKRVADSVFVAARK